MSTLEATAKSVAARDAESSAQATELARQVKEGVRLIEACIARSPLSDVMPGEATASAMQAIHDHPVYARVQRIARRLLDPGLHIDGDAATQAGLRRTHELFELLVFYRLAARLRDDLGSSWTWQSPVTRHLGALAGMPDGAAFIAKGPDDQTVELRYQQVFRSYVEPPRKPCWSLTGERRPDYVLGLFRGGTLLGWLILDAKYRASRSAIHDGLGDLHVYRDSLRWFEQPARACFIIVPAAEKDAAIYSSAAYHAEHEFGVLRLDEDTSLATLSAWLSELAGER